MSRLLTTRAVEKLPPREAKEYFDSWAADLRARMLMLDLAEGIYLGPGHTAVNEAVAMLLHACDYLDDRIGYEIGPPPKGMIRMPLTVQEERKS